LQGNGGGGAHEGGSSLVTMLPLLLRVTLVWRGPRLWLLARQQGHRRQRLDGERHLKLLFGVEKLSEHRVQVHLASERRIQVLSYGRVASFHPNTSTPSGSKTREASELAEALFKRAALPQWATRGYMLTRRSEALHHEPCPHSRTAARVYTCIHPEGRVLRSSRASQ
jgi:hypothetical protein